ncbi:PQQ-dependent sugar dehydrogenase [Haliea sp. E17]|uniref:PQQ-dependent sugar dehydrogenase n=1 Tax=Haliea sp. E17 TaxID=3401576 RepID=UPI003AAD511B
MPAPTRIPPESLAASHHSLTLFATSLLLSLVAALSLSACAAEAPDHPFAVTVKADFDQPWAMTFLPDGRLLVTEKAGTLKLYDDAGVIGEVAGVPDVAFSGQGGLGDVVLHPDFGRNSLVYLSYAEKGAGGYGAAVARGVLQLDSAGGGQLTELQVIWRQVPKVSGAGHYGHRIAFGADGKLWISSGERQKFDPAQDMGANLGKIIRLNDDGSLPGDNPFANRGGVAAQVWTLGHRNPLGLAFDGSGQLWEVEMGPSGGDELNRIVRGENYGYPIVSEGRHYSGIDIPDHDTRPEFAAPIIAWSPVISPSSLIFYDGEEFPQWRGNAFIGGLSSKSLVRIQFAGDSAREAERFAMGARIREVEQAPDGSLWLLEDGSKGSEGRLLRLAKPAQGD